MPAENCRKRLKLRSPVHIRLSGVSRLEFLDLLHSMVIFLYWHTSVPLSYCRSSLHKYRGVVDVYNLDGICGCMLFWETHMQHFLVLILRVCVDFTCSHIYFAKILWLIELGWLSYTGLTFQYCGLRSYCWVQKVCQNGVMAIMQNNPDAAVAGLTGICVDLDKHASHSNSMDASCLVISSTC